MNVARTPALERTDDQLRDAIATIEDLANDKPLGVETAFDHPGLGPVFSAQLDSIAQLDLQRILEGVYLTSFRGKTAGLDAKFAESNTNNDREKVIFTPAGKTAKDVMDEIAHVLTSARSGAENRDISIEVRLTGDDAASEQLAAELAAQFPDAADASQLISIRRWATLSERPESAAADLLALGKTRERAPFLRVVVAQNAALPENAEQILSILKTTMGDHMAVLMLLTDSLQAVSLDVNDLFDMKRYALVASQA
ncbi:MAG: hypothetical protein JO102_01885 [Elusimicrobia bacterium]|nr:hypothetical protein [Elusimicrobiota bacterium]